MAVDLDDLRESHDADGAHSHLYATMVKIADGAASKTVRRESSRRRARRRRDALWDGPVRGRSARKAQASGVAGYTRVGLRRWTRRRLYPARRRVWQAQRAAVLPLALGRTTFRVARMGGRAVLHPFRTLWVLFVILMSVVLLTPITLGQVGSGLAELSPITCGQPAVQPVDGMEAISYRAGRAVNATQTPLEPQQIVDGVLGAARWVGRQVGTFQAGQQGEPVPLEPVEPPGYDPRLQATAVAAPATGDALVAQVAMQAGWTGAELTKAVAVAFAESDGDPRAINPQVIDGSQAHGLWQTMMPMHEALYAGADPLDPAANARVAHKLWNSGGWAPWKASAAQHEANMPRARAAVAAAQASAQGAGLAAPVGAADVPSATSCQAPPGGIVRQASLDNTGLANGQLPASMLAPLSWAPGQSLRPEAAAAAEALNIAYRARFGTDLVVSDSYRTLAGQHAVAASKPGLAAVPGTSEHGWGLALDLGGGVQTWGTVQREWLVAHAASYGWVSPPWAQPGKGREEPWHWEYGDRSAQRAG